MPNIFSPIAKPVIAFETVEAGLAGLKINKLFIKSTAYATGSVGMAMPA